MRDYGRTLLTLGSRSAREPIGSTCGQSRLHLHLSAGWPSPAPMEMYVMVDPVRDWLIAAYLSDPTPDRYRRPDGTWEPMVLVTLAALADRIQALGLPLTPTLDRCQSAGWTADMYCDLTPTDTPVTPLPHSVTRLRLPPGRHRLVGIWRAVTVDSDAVAVPPAETHTAKGGRRAPRDAGQPSRDRQDDILSAIAAAGVPLTRSELVDALRLPTEGRLGHHLAWMVAHGILVSIPHRGYWPAGRTPPA